LQHFISPHEIQAELETLGHKVRNVLNIRHRVTKEPLPLYFVDLEPQYNNKSIYDLQLLCHMKIVVEAPRKKNYVVQCTRCQSCGHTKSYCSRPYVCVKCGANIIRHCAQKTLLPQLRVLYVAGSTHRVTKDESYTKTYNKHAVKPIAQYNQPPLRLLLPQLTSLIPANFLYLANYNLFWHQSFRLFHTPVLSHTINSRST
jgi:hypothetical protein